MTVNWAELGSAGSGERGKLGDEWQISEGASLQIEIGHSAITELQQTGKQTENGGRISGIMKFDPNLLQFKHHTRHTEKTEASCLFFLPLIVNTHLMFLI